MVCGHLHADVVVGESLHGLAFAGMLPQDGAHGSHKTLAKRTMLALGQGNEALAAGVLLLRTDHVGNLKGLRAGPLGVTEHVELRDV